MYIRKDGWLIFIYGVSVFVGAMLGAGAGIAITRFIIDW